MPDAPKVAPRMTPTTAWSLLTDAPLLGISLAREAGRLLTWDEARRVELRDGRGGPLALTHAPGRVLAGAISDDGSLVALLIDGARLWLLGPDLKPIDERAAGPDPMGLAVDAHGRYVAVSSRGTTTHLFTRYGRNAGSFETLQPMAHIRFVAALPMIIGASAYGMIVGVELSAAGAGKLAAEVAWKQQPMSNIGRLACSGDAGMILTSCYTHGIQRYDARGHGEGSYHLGGTAAHAVPDFAGRSIAVATTEGELSVLNSGGNVRWKTALPRPPLALEIDALGRYLIYGLATGEVVRLDLEKPPEGSAPAETSALPRSASIRRPDWSNPVAQSEEQAESTVVAVLDDPPRVAVMTNSNRLQVFTTGGGSLGHAPDIAGTGRFLRTSPGWIAAATDKMIVLYDARRNGAQRLDLSLAELTHMAIRPDTYGIACVQERDRLGRASLASRWVWNRELKSAVEDLAIGPDGLTAITSDDGRLQVFDAAGEPAGSYQSDPPEPLLMVDAPPNAPGSVAWITLARRNQVLRGHRANGQVAWESPIPWEAWLLQRQGPILVAAAPDGRSLALDGGGNPVDQSRAEASPSIYMADPDGRPLRVTRQGVHLICAELGGRVRWRAVAEGPLGPMAAATPGVAAMIGRSLCWFGAQGPGISG